MFMGDLRHGTDVNEVGIRIAYGLNVKELRILPDSPFKNGRALCRIDKDRFDAKVQAEYGQKGYRSRHRWL